MITKVMLLAAPGLKATEEDEQGHPGRRPRDKQYLFIFMCLIQWLMLVGYPAQRFTFTRFFWLGIVCNPAFFHSLPAVSEQMFHVS